MNDVERSKVRHSREDLAGNSPNLAIALDAFVYCLKSDEALGYSDMQYEAVTRGVQSIQALTSRRVRLLNKKTLTIITSCQQKKQ